MMSKSKRGTKARIGRQVKHSKTIKVVISILLAIVGVTTAILAYQYTYSAKLESELEAKQSVIEKKGLELKKQTEKLNLTDKQKLELQKQVEDLNKAKTDLESQLQAKKAEKARLAVVGVQVVKAQAVPTYSLPANQAKAFIYQHESGNNPNAVNSIGCRGLGQACPGSKLPCGADYACQDAWFTNYAMTRYGSWEAAYQFWIAHRWW